MPTGPRRPPRCCSSASPRRSKRHPTAGSWTGTTTASSARSCSIGRTRSSGSTSPTAAPCGACCGARSAARSAARSCGTATGSRCGSRSRATPSSGGFCARIAASVRNGRPRLDGRNVVRVQDVDTWLQSIQATESTSGSSNGQRPPEDAAVRRDVEPVPRGVEHPVGIVLGDRDREARRQSAARFAPRRAAVAREHERRAALDDARRPSRPPGRGDDARQGDVGTLRRGHFGAVAEQRLRLDVDEEDSRDGADGGDHAGSRRREGPRRRAVRCVPPRPARRRARAPRGRRQRTCRPRRSGRRRPARAATYVPFTVAPRGAVRDDELAARRRRRRRPPPPRRA